MATLSTSQSGPALPDPSDWSLWGTDGVGLHDRSWLARGCGVVRAGSQSRPPMGAKVFALSASSRVIFEMRLGKLQSLLRKADAVVLHLEDSQSMGHGYREEVVSTGMDGEAEVRRMYHAPTDAVTRVILTDNKDLAKHWARSQATDPEQWLRAQGIEPTRTAVPACVHDGTTEHGTSQWLSELATDDQVVQASFPRARRLAPRVWADPTVVLPTESRIVGPVFIGAGVVVPDGAVIVGPLVLTDREQSVSPAPTPAAVEPRESAWNAWPVASSHPRFYRWSKRIFDVVFSLTVLTLALPFMLLVALAIMLEDGRPVFFGHRRQTIFGREFRCLKFRSMVRNADAMQEALRKKGDNDADGPQFTLKDDPRILKVGHFIRKTHLDELPQFINVLRGEMSVVGPRPSPDKENQYCPHWRETRLSVRAGITGLWQVSSTRKANTDFQEWIRYDIEYVQRRCWHLDLWIMVQTLRKMLPTWLGGRKAPSED